MSLKTLNDKDFRVFAFLENKEAEINLRAPAAAVRTEDTQKTCIISEIPQTDAGIINYAFAILKENLRLVGQKNVSKFYKCFDMLEWRPILGSAFGFVQQKKTTRAMYSLVDGTTKVLDKFLGKEWDLLDNGSYLVTKICFYKKKMSHTPISPGKLQCQLYMMQGTFGEDDNYRETALPAMLDQFRPINCSTSYITTGNNENETTTPGNDQEAETTTMNNQEEPRPIKDHIRQPADDLIDLTALDWDCHVCDGAWGCDPHPDDDMIRCITCVRKCIKDGVSIKTLPCAHFPSCAEKDKKCTLHSMYCK